MADGSPSASPQAAPASEASQASPESITLPGLLPETDSLDRTDEFVNPPDLNDQPEENPEDQPAARLAKVEQQLKTLQGMHKSYEAQAKRGKEAESLYTQQREAALAWKAQAEAMQAQLAAVMSGQPAHPQTPSPQAGEPQATKSEIKSLADEALASIDESEYQAIVDQYGERTAQAWQLKRILSHVENALKSRTEDLQKQFLERLQPFEEDAETAGFYDSAKQSFAQIADWKYPDSDEYGFPELRDHAKAREIVRLWQSQRGNWNEEFALNPQSVVWAVEMWRGLQRYNQRSAPQPTTPPEVVRPEERADLDLDTTTAPVSRATGPMTEQDRFRANFRRREADPLRLKLGYAP